MPYNSVTLNAVMNNTESKFHGFCSRTVLYHSFILWNTIMNNSDRKYIINVVVMLCINHGFLILHLSILS